ncbi:MAG: TspO/MBR family protein [Rhizomicrobium sp.]
MTFIDHAPDRRRYGVLALFALSTLGVGAVAGIVTAPEVTGWYATLTKPSFNPPNWVFGPVWTLLYLMMAVAAWRVWRVAGGRSRPLALFYVQLAFNLAWSFLFFRAHATGAALIEICVLLILLFWTAASFARYDRIATWLMVPYIAWVSFAAMLNAAIWELN